MRWRAGRTCGLLIVDVFPVTDPAMTSAHLMSSRWQPKGEWVGECLGAAGLLFAAVSAVRLVTPGGPLDGVHTIIDGRTLVIGCAIAGAVVGYGLTPLGRRSGGHINPAVTLFVWLRRGLSGIDAIAYVAAQFAGSFIGVGVGRLVWGRAVVRIHYALIQPKPGLGPLATTVGEFAMTCALLGVFAASMRLKAKLAAPASVFAVIALMIWFGGPWSGGSFNPIRNFSPAVLSADYGFQAIYLAAPLIAGVVMAVAFAVSEQLQFRNSVHESRGAGDGYAGSDSVAAAGQ